MSRLREMIDVEIDVLAPPPLHRHEALSTFSVLPESSELRSSGAIYESVFKDAVGYYDLIHFIKEDGPHYPHDCSLLGKVLMDRKYDLIFADEAFWLLTGLSMNWVSKNFTIVYMSDFIGMHSMSSCPEDEVFFRTKNAQFLLATSFLDKFIFLGSPDDVPDITLGKTLPNQRTWARRNCTFMNSVVKPYTAESLDRQTVRKSLSLPEKSTIYLFMVYFIGTDFRKRLQRIFCDTIKAIRTEDPSAYVILVNPDLEEFSNEEGQTVKFLKNAYLYNTAANFVVAQAGLAKATELSNSGTPFLLIPPDRHFEAELLLGFRLKNEYRGGKMLLLRNLSPEALCSEIRTVMESREPITPIQADDGSQIAALLVNMLGDTNAT